MALTVVAATSAFVPWQMPTNRIRISTFDTDDNDGLCERLSLLLNSRRPHIFFDEASLKKRNQKSNVATRLSRAQLR